VDNFILPGVLFLADQPVPLRTGGTTGVYFKNYHFPSTLMVCFLSRIFVDMEHCFSSPLS